MGDVDEKSCKNCMEYRSGDCIGRELCDFYRPAPTERKKYWPKVMRSNYSYAGSKASDSYITGLDYQFVPPKKAKKSKKRNKTESTGIVKTAPTVSKSSSWKHKGMVNEIGYKRECYNHPGTVERLLRFLKGKFIIWVSVETSQYGSELVYLSKCLLQLNDHYLTVDNATSDKNVNRAMLKGIIEAAKHITRPCFVYLVTDRILLSGIESVQPYYDDDLLEKIFNSFREKECFVTEIVIKDGANMIRNQVATPRHIEK